MRIWSDEGQRETGEQRHGRWMCPLHTWRAPVGIAGYEIVQRVQPSYRPEKPGGVIHSMWEEVGLR